MSTMTLSNGARVVKIAGYTNDCRKCGQTIVKGQDRVVQVRHIDPNVSTKWWVHERCEHTPYPSMEEFLKIESRRYVRRGRGGKSKVATGTRMASKFESTCKACGKPIAIGAMIEKTDAGWVHLECAAGQATQQHTQHQGCQHGHDHDAQQHSHDNEPQVQTQAVQTEPIASELLDRIFAGLNNTLEVMRELRADNEQLHERLGQLEAAQPKQIVIKTKDGDQINNVNGATHPIFEHVLKLAAARKNVFIPGPTGCGKSHLAKQVAEALGLPFGFVSCSVGMSEGHLTGRLLPIGDGGKFEYVISEFVKCYENGGVFLIDEMDAADANVLLVINAALANGKMPVPNRPEKPYAERHPDFVCIAAANTWGSGADRQYVGRNQLDNATLDRFRIGQIAMDYDTELEKKLCPNIGLYERLIGYREKARANRLERAISTRFLIDAYDMVTNHGWSSVDVDNALFADWRADEVAKVKGY